MRNKRKLLFLAIFTLPLLAVLSQCSLFGKKETDPRGLLYAGSSTCIKCHSSIYSDYLHTAHFSTSQLADKHTVSGSFKPGSNEYLFSNNVKVVMKKDAGGLYQVAYENGKKVNQQRFDIAIGGVKAETYLYWKGNRLYQLPISYFKTLHKWTNSPGYDSTSADFSRLITVGCLECHASYIEANNPTTDPHTNVNYSKNTLILGIDCERCHGPASDHVYYQTTHPEDKTAQHIITYASLTRAEKINMCTVCHSGSSGTVLRSTFGFKPNDNLTDYKIEDMFQTTNPDKLDVHANQGRLLMTSKCFINSNMDCATCHNLHRNERQQLTMYSQKCMDCHSTAKHNFCPEYNKLGEAIKFNCIDCHMPNKPSSLIAVGTGGKSKAVPYLVRDHHIAIYAEPIIQISTGSHNGQVVGKQNR